MPSSKTPIGTVAVAPGAERRARVELDQFGADAFVITNAENIRYLSGFTGSNGILLLAAGDAVLFTDPRYTIQASQECDCPTVTVKGPLAKAVAAEIDRRRCRRIGFEKNRLSWLVYEALRSSLPPKALLIPIDSAIENLRMVKSPEEIAAIRASVALNSRAFDNAIARFRLGMRERELAAEIDYQMRLEGASGPAFDTIVAAGARTALPHAHPGDAPIVLNQLLLVDMGAFAAGYASDMTRTMAVGRIRPELRRMYRAVLEAQLAAIAAVRPGRPASAVDAAARKVLRQNGLAAEFVHSTGHGLGLEIHEVPRLGKNEKRKLEPGMTITIEPGVYREGVGGIRIEDTVLVTERGCEVLTPTPKELLSIE